MPNVCDLVGLLIVLSADPGQELKESKQSNKY